MFSFQGFEKSDSRVISTKAQIFDIFKPAGVYLWTQRHGHLYLSRRKDIQTGMKTAAYSNGEPMFAQSVNTLKTNSGAFMDQRSQGPAVSTQDK